MRRQSILRLCSLLLLLLATLSCDFEPGPESAGGPAAPASGGTGVTAPAQGPTTAPNPTMQRQPTSVPPPATAVPTGKVEELALTEVRGLEKLNSYRLQIKSVRTSGQAQKESSEILYEVTRQPVAVREVSRYTASGKPDFTSEIIRSGKTVYTKVGKSWLVEQQAKNVEIPSQSCLMSEAVLGTEKAVFVGSETIDGLATRRYRYESKANVAPQQGPRIEEYRAEMWVADSLGACVKATLHLVGVDDKGVRYTHDWESAVLDVNKPLTVKLPEGIAVPPLPDDIPLMPEAALEDVGILPDKRFTYVVMVPKSTAEVDRFYREQMVAMGWKLEPQRVQGMLSFNKNGRRAEVLLGAQGAGARLTINTTGF